MIIAAVRNEQELEAALHSRVKMIFWLSPNILTLAETVQAVHAAGKKIFVHMDLAEGLGKDRPGLQYAGKAGVDGIISTRVNIIKAAREVGLFTIQRFFIVDSQSVNTTVEAIKSSRPDMIEVMPGIATKVIADLRTSLQVPIIAGGLIETKQEVQEALHNGATAISTGKAQLWGRMEKH